MLNSNRASVGEARFMSLKRMFVTKNIDLCDITRLLPLIRGQSVKNALRVP